MVTPVNVTTNSVYRIPFVENTTNETPLLIDPNIGGPQVLIQNIGINDTHTSSITATFFNGIGSTTKEIYYAGIATLVNGTVTVNTNGVGINSKILISYDTILGTPGFLSISDRISGSSFNINSTSATDNSIVTWAIIKQ